MGEELKELKDTLHSLATDFAVMNKNIETQGNIIEKLTASFDKLSVFIERTNENDKKIDYLFKECSKIYNTGTKTCPVNTEKLTENRRRIDKLSGYLMYLVMGFIMQVIALIIYLLEKHLV